MTFILERLAIGNLEDLENPGEEIGFILNVAEEVEVNLPTVKYKKIRLKDGMPIPVEKMREAIRWIREHISSGKVLIACHYGVGRSASIVIGYLSSFGFGYEEALDFVSSKGRRVDPMPDLEKTIRLSLNSLEGAPGCTLQ